MTVSQSLWAQAAANLSANDQLPFDLNDPSIATSINDVLDSAKLMQEKCKKKQWKYKNQKGEEVILRDVFAKVINWVEKFKTIGDTIVQYDPVHAALPWAAVRFLLQVATNDQQTFGGMAAGLELVSDLITRGTIWEQLYLTKLSSMQNQLIKAMLKLYTSVLVYLGKAGKYYSQNTSKRLIKSIVSSPERHIDEIVENQKLVEECARVISSEVLESTSHTVQSISETTEMMDEKLNLILYELGMPFNRIATQVSNINNVLNSEERIKFFDWLSEIPYEKHHRAKVELLLTGTCQWLYQKPVFQDWERSSASSILWLHGIPGSGKSMLTCSVIERHRMMNESRNASPLFAYFYCYRDTQETERSDSNQILRSILEQLSSSDMDAPIRQPVVDAYQKHRREARGRRPALLTLEDCTKIILQLVEENPAIIIIDALDECDPSRRSDLILALRQVIEKSSSVVKIFISSRDDEDIVDWMSLASEVRIRADDNTGDIEAFTTSQVKKAIYERRILHGHVSASLEAAIIDTLNSKANGMFRLVGSHIQSLMNPSKIKTEDNVRTALSRLPEQLNDSYKIIMEQVSSQEQPNPEIAVTALKWLSCARRQLKSKEFLSAIAITPKGKCITLSRTELLNICCNFVIYESNQDVFRFAHLSVREYLEKNDHCGLSSSNAVALHRCLDVTFGLSDQATRDRVAIHNRKLSAYASAYWPQHYRTTTSDDFDPELRSKLLRFWLQVCRADLYFAKWFVVTSNFRQLLLRRKDLVYLFTAVHITAGDNKQELPADSAVTNGRLIQIFLQQQKYSSQPSLLHFAILAGDVAVARLLIELGSQVNMCNQNNESPLMLALDGGCQKTIALLLDNGADHFKSIGRLTGDDWISRYKTCLLAAVEYSSMQTVIELFSNGEYVFKDREGWAALYTISVSEINHFLRVAIRRDHQALVQTLKDRLKIQDRSIIDPLGDDDVTFTVHDVEVDNAASTDTHVVLSSDTRFIIFVRNSDDDVASSAHDSDDDNIASSDTHVVLSSDTRLIVFGSDSYTQLTGFGSDLEDDDVASTITSPVLRGSQFAAIVSDSDDGDIASTITRPALRGFRLTEVVSDSDDNDVASTVLRTAWRDVELIDVEYDSDEDLDSAVTHDPILGDVWGIDSASDSSSWGIAWRSPRRRRLRASVQSFSLDALTYSDLRIIFDKQGSGSDHTQGWYRTGNLGTYTTAPSQDNNDSGWSAWSSTNEEDQQLLLLEWKPMNEDLSPNLSSDFPLGLVFVLGLALALAFALLFTSFSA